MTDGQKAVLARAALTRLADEQPTHNIICTWAIKGCAELPTVALAQLYDQFHKEGG